MNCVIEGIATRGVIRSGSCGSRILGGALILEPDARPGLNIQIAKRAGLLPPLKLVEQNNRSLHGVEERVAFARTHFGAQA